LVDAVNNFLTWAGDFVKANVDKLLVLLVLLIFYRGAWYGYHYKIEGLAAASIDLVKQFGAAFLTLTVANRMANHTNGGKGNGTTPPENSSTSSTTAGK
jgi:hypothetical protein